MSQRLSNIGLILIKEHKEWAEQAFWNFLEMGIDLEP